MPTHLCMFGCIKCIMIPQLPWFLLSIALIPYPSENPQIHLSVPLNMFYDSKYACGWLMLVWGAFKYRYIHNETCVLSASFKVVDHVAAWDCVITVPVYISLCVCQQIYTACGILWLSRKVCICGWCFMCTVVWAPGFGQDKNFVSTDIFSQSNRNYSVMFSHSCPLCKDQLSVLRLYRQISMILLRSEHSNFIFYLF